MEVLFIHDIDPILVNINPLQVRYYGLLFALATIMTFLFLRYLFKVKGYNTRIVDDYAIYLLIGIIIGSRIIHVLFYHSDYYLSNPVEILKIWKGGIASHGATLGAILASIIFAIRKKNISSHQILDLAVIPISLATAFIRLGNLINAEIVGRVTDMPWAIAYKYERYHLTSKIFYYYKKLLSEKDSFIREITMKYHSLSDDKLDTMLSGKDDVALKQMLSELPRHPSQIYEMIYGIVLFIILFTLFKTLRNKLADGVLFYSFFVGYFSFRFLTEFVKEYQTLIPQSLTMGQYLSIPFIVIGIIMISILQRRKNKASNIETNH